MKGQLDLNPQRGTPAELPAALPKGKQSGRDRSKLFEYTARRADGTQVTGREVAAGLEDLDRKLDGDGLLLIRARKVARGPRGSSGKIARPHLIGFTNQLATMLRSGIPLVTGLRHMRTRARSKELSGLIDDLVRDLEAGETFADALDRQHKSFPEVYRASVRAGERSTDLPDVLTRQAAYLQWVREIKGTAAQALVYPAILATAVVGLITILLTFLLPRLVKLYPGGEADLPRETRLVMGISSWIGTYYPVLLGGAVALGISWAVALRIAKSRRFLSRQLMRVPRLGEVLRMISTSRFATTASILHNAGCDMVGTLSMAGATCGSAYLSAAFERTTERVQKGASITESLEREEGMDPLLIQLVAVGETSGDLGGSLRHLAQCYDEEVPRSVKWALSLIEPLVIAVGGAIVLFILIAALLPVVKLYEVLA